MARKKSELSRNALLAKALQTPLNEKSLQAVANELETNPIYSLEPDPTDELGMTIAEKSFTKWYIQHRNIAVAAQLAEISVEDGMKVYRSFACQSELKRIDMAYKLRQLNNSTMSLEQIGSVLTGYVFDQMPEAERLSTRDKMNAMKMIMDIHILKQKVVETAEPIEIVDVEEQVKDLSVDALKTLIEKTKSYDDENIEKESLIKQIDDESMLSNEDLHYLRSLKIEQLQSLLADKEKAKTKEFERQQAEAALKKRELDLTKLTPVEKDEGPSEEGMSCD